MTVVCPYCQQPAKLVTGLDIYPHRIDLRSYKFWHCEPCDAYVGCNRRINGTTPLGRLANKELRLAKIRAHAAFDPLWKSGKMQRGAAYTWLSKQMNLSIEKTHIGMFNLEQCREVVRICNVAQTGEPKCLGSVEGTRKIDD